MSAVLLEKACMAIITKVKSEIPMVRCVAKKLGGDCYNNKPVMKSGNEVVAYVVMAVGAYNVID